MKRTTAHWFALDTGVFLNDTEVMSLSETGAYIKLLSRAFLDPRCSLPDDDKYLAKILHVSPDEWASLRDAVLEHFEKRDGRLFNDDLLEEKRNVERKIAAAYKANQVRWDAHKAGGAKERTKDRTRERTNDNNDREKDRSRNGDASAIRQESDRTSTTITTIPSSSDLAVMSRIWRSAYPNGVCLSLTNKEPQQKWTALISQHSIEKIGRAFKAWATSDADGIRFHATESYPIARFLNEAGRWLAEEGE